jgi:hypothetical protein
MSKHVGGNSMNDGNISYVQGKMIAEVVHVSHEHPNERYGKREVLFSSTDWEKAQEKYTEALMLRDQSGFKDAATIRKHLEQIEEQYS